MIMDSYNHADDQNFLEERAANSVYLKGVLSKLREIFGDEDYICTMENMFMNQFTAEGLYRIGMKLEEFINNEPDYYLLEKFKI